MVSVADCERGVVIAAGGGGKSKTALQAAFASAPAQGASVAGGTASSPACSYEGPTQESQ
ncbi:MAG: hypothetical protein R3B13_40160 [Polyangiaceae bacterium]